MIDEIRDIPSGSNSLRVIVGVGTTCFEMCAAYNKIATISLIFRQVDFCKKETPDSTVTSWRIEMRQYKKDIAACTLAIAIEIGKWVAAQKRIAIESVVAGADKNIGEIEVCSVFLYIGCDRRIAWLERVVPPAQKQIQSRGEILN